MTKSKGAKRGPKNKPKSELRVPCNRRVKPETMARLKALSAAKGVSEGKVIDEAVEAL